MDRSRNTLGYACAAAQIDGPTTAGLGRLSDETPRDLTLLEELTRRIAGINGNLAESRLRLTAHLDHLMGNRPSPPTTDAKKAPLQHSVIQGLVDQVEVFEVQELELRDLIDVVRRL